MTTPQHKQGDVPKRDAQVILTGMGMFQQTVDVGLPPVAETQLPNNCPLGIREDEK